MSQLLSEVGFNIEELATDTVAVQNDDGSTRPFFLLEGYVTAPKKIPLAELEIEWNEWVRSTGRVPDRPDGAFIGFCRQKPSARQTQLFDDWH